MTDPHATLLRALCRRHPELRLVDSATEPWASVTFTGARHVFTFEPTDAPGDLADAEFVLPGHIVADVAVAARPTGLVIEALTIESA